MNLDELDLHSPSADMLQGTREQLAKDLSIADFEFAEVNYPDLPSMVREVQAFFEKLQQQNPAALMRAVNRVDLSESQYRKVKSMPGDFCENLAKAAVLRAFQKVVIRRKFS